MTDIDVRDEREPGHFWADNEVYDHYGKRIGAMGFAIYMALCRHAKAGVSFPSIRRLADDLGIKSEQTVRKALAILEEVQLIRIERRPANPEAKRGTQTHRFFILKVEKDKRDIKVAQGEGALNVPPPASDVPRGVHQTYPNKTYLEQDLKNKSGGDARANGTAAAGFDTIKELEDLGLSERQAVKYAPLQTFVPDVFPRIKEWQKEKAGKPGVRSVVGLLSSYLERGKLPEDLPAAPTPMIDPSDQITWDEVTGMPIVPESVRRRLEADSKKTHLYHRG